MLRMEWFLIFAVLALGSCSLAVVGTAVHCIYTGDPNDCPQIRSNGKCITSTLGCPDEHKG